MLPGYLFHQPCSYALSFTLFSVSSHGEVDERVWQINGACNATSMHFLYEWNTGGKNTCWTAIGYVGQSHLGPESIWPEWGSQIENTSMLSVLCNSWVLLCHYHRLLHVSHVSVLWIFVTSWSFLCQFSFSTYILYLHYWCLTYLSSILFLYLVLSIILVCLLFLIYIFFLNKPILRFNRVNILMNLCF